MLSPDEKEKMLAGLLSTPEERKATSEHSLCPEGTFDITKDPYNHMMRLVFSRWKPFILRAIAVDDGTYFSRFFKQLPITQKVLSQNLKDMQADELIYRDVLPEVPPRVEYTLTELGYSLKPILDAMWTWGEEYKSRLQKQEQ